jgi:hypothetical protein
MHPADNTAGIVSAVRVWTLVYLVHQRLPAFVVFACRRLTLWPTRAAAVACPGWSEPHVGGSSRHSRAIVGFEATAAATTSSGRASMPAIKSVLPQLPLVRREMRSPPTFKSNRPRSMFREINV